MCPPLPSYVGPSVYPIHTTTMDSPGSTAADASSSGMFTHSQSNPNPFYLKFNTGNIHICQGCGQSLKTSTGSIPHLPYNLVIARADKRPYRDSSGELVTHSSYSNAHYHVAVSCICQLELMFQPSILKIPVDIAL